MTAAEAAEERGPDQSLRSTWERVVVHFANTTPPTRERTVDGLRAIAIVGVVLGHWLVTALVAQGSELEVASPLANMPYLVPATWVMQTLGLFFLVGGFASAKSLISAQARGDSYRLWLGRRLVRLGRPVLYLIGTWAPLTIVLRWLGLPDGSESTILKLVVSPLWFVAVYLVLTALTPVAVAGHRRLGIAAVLVPLLVVALLDATRYGFWPSGPGWLGGLSVVAAWLVPYQMGVAWAHERLRSRRAGRALIITGGGLAVSLVMLFGYPASMVGITGMSRSNLNPPSLLAPALAAVQTGLALLMRDRLARLLSRPSVWAVVALINLSAMTVFLWHQTALLAVTLGALIPGPFGGLHTDPTSPAWVLARLFWLPFFASVLFLCWKLFHHVERAQS